MSEKKISRDDIEKEKIRRLYEMSSKKNSDIEVRYKIILSNTRETITVREEELLKVMEGIAKRAVVVLNEGIFNPSYLVAIVLDKERMNAMLAAKKSKSKFSEPSPFAKLISKKFTQLTEGLREK